MGNLLENVVCRHLSKKEYNKVTDPIKIKLGELQRKAKDKKIPVLIIMEGLESSGIGASINEILQALDPRGYNVVSHRHIDEMNRPFMWQYWKEIPAQGEFTIFDHSWYYSALMRRTNLDRRFSEINETEKTLLESGMLIFKFFIYISKKEQRKRFEEAESNPATAWKVTKSDWEQNKNYDIIAQVCENIIGRTNTSDCEWNLICAEDVDGARAEILRILTQDLEVKLSSEPEKPKELALPYRKPFSFDTVDLSQSMDKPTYRKKLKKLQKRIYDLQHLLYMHRIPLVIAYEGWDAGGKGGNIKRLVERMDPRGYRVIPIGAPNDIEKAHQYLWRFWHKFPKPGHVAIFDRSWYGRVLVERVEGFATPAEWKRAFKEINEMERQWIEDGTILIKFWLHISKEEQLKRFKDRTDTPEKKWKITDEDWRNRKKWDEYAIAAQEMISRSDGRIAPWHIIPGNDKFFARIYSLKTVVRILERELKKRNLL